MFKAAAFLFLSAAAHAQPTAWLGVGASAPASGKTFQNLSYWTAGAYLVSKPAGLYSYTLYSSQFQQNKLRTTAQTGGAAHLREYGPLSVYVFGTVAVSQTSTSTGIGGAAGVIAFLRIPGTKHWNFTGSIGYDSGQPVKQVLFGIGRSFD